MDEREKRIKNAVAKLVKCQLDQNISASDKVTFKNMINSKEKRILLSIKIVESVQSLVIWPNVAGATY